VVAEHAMRLAWEVKGDQDLMSGEVKNLANRFTDLEVMIMKSLTRIETRLGTVEKRPAVPPEAKISYGTLKAAIGAATAPATPSQRPVSYHDLPDAIAQAMPEVERRQQVAWWMGFIEGGRRVIRNGLKKGAENALAAIIFTLAVLAVGYFLRDISQAIVKQGQSHEVPRFHAPE